MEHEYVIRETARADHQHTRFVVVDEHLQLHHVTIADSALFHGYGDEIIRFQIGRHYPRPALVD